MAIFILDRSISYYDSHSVHTTHPKEFYHTCSLFFSFLHVSVKIGKYVLDKGEEYMAT